VDQNAAVALQKEPLLNAILYVYVISQYEYDILVITQVQGKALHNYTALHIPPPYYKPSHTNTRANHQ